MVVRKIKHTTQNLNVLQPTSSLVVINAGVNAVSNISNISNQFIDRS